MIIISDAVQIELAKAIPQDIIAFASLLAAIFSFLAHKQAKRTEINTNHIKDELVTEVRKAAFAAGQKHEIDLAENRETDYQADRTDQKEGN